jgi:basic amino acid/polyamine antiporter, APA family
LGVVVAAGVSLALIKDLPAMLMGISRLPFAWAEDGIFPAPLAAVHPVRRTPHVAIITTAVMASLGVLGCAVAGDFLLAVDITVTAMLVNYVLMSLSVLVLPRHNVVIAARIGVLRDAGARTAIAAAGVVSLGALLVVNTVRDLRTDRPWYVSSTWDWVIVLAIGTVLYAREVRRLRASGVDVHARFRETPAQ